MYNKSHIQNWINLGVPSLISARTFLDDLSTYVQELGDDSLIAMTGGQAKVILNYLDSVGSTRYGKLRKSMLERIRISERQGKYSLERKRMFQLHRKPT